MPAPIMAAQSARLSSAARMPLTTRTRPIAEEIAPRTSNGIAGSGGSGSVTHRRHSTAMRMTTAAWNRNATRQLKNEVMKPPINGPVAAPTPPIALIAPNARAREVMSVNSSVVRM